MSNLLLMLIHEILTLLLPFPDGRKVNLALSTTEGSCHSIGLLVYGKIIYHSLQAKQIDKVRVAGIRYKVHLWWWWLRWRYLWRGNGGEVDELNISNLTASSYSPVAKSSQAACAVPS